MRRLRRSTSLLFLIAAMAGPSFALTDEEVFRNFRFNLINPGARSLALGGAFISLADDATAALANPAGLGFLGRWEFFGELRSIDSGVEASVRRQTIGGFDTVLLTGSDIEDSVSPSFLSGVVTFRKGLRWALGFSRQELLNINNATLSRYTFTSQGSPGTFLSEGAGVIDLNVLNWNVSAGFRIGDRWGVGLTVTWSQLDVTSDVTNTLIDTTGLVTNDLIDRPVRELTADVRTAVDDTDDDVVLSLGLIYKRNRWGAGAVYRQGPDFSVQQQVLLTEDATGEPGIDLFNVRGEYGDSIANAFALPDVIGIGGHWYNKNRRLTLTLNVDRVLYSNLMDNFVPGVNVLTDYDARFEIDDATDVRFGTEYVFLPKGKPLALRGGIYTEGSSTIRARDTGTRSFATEDVFAGADDQVHGTIGLGLEFSNRAKLDLAADFAEVVNQFVISFIYQGKAQPRGRP